MNLKIGITFFIVFVQLLLPKVFAQNNPISVSESEHNYGFLEDINMLRSDFIITNKGTKTLYLMRADVEKDVKVLVFKKSLQANDTTLISVFFTPANTGKFSRKINLFTSAMGDPLVLTITGTIKNLKKDNTTDCFTFGKPHKQTPEKTVVVSDFQPPIGSQKKPLQIIEEDSIPKAPTSATVATEINTENLNRITYKPNNLVFLIDVSRSMADSSKLPLMKLSLLELINDTRDIDQVTIITYADSVLLKCEHVIGSDKKQLSSVISGLGAKGYTRGAKAVLFALETAKKNYLEEGNNQVFLATDGKFPFYETHYNQWLQKSEGKNITLSVLAFGNDKEAMSNLKEIATFGKGSFIKIKTFEKDKVLLLEEIKLRSKRNP